MSRRFTGVKVTKDQTRNVFASIGRMGKQHVVIGVPESEDQRERDADGDYVNPIGNAALYYVHDMGSAAANIPQRETLRPGVEDAAEDCAAVLAASAVQEFTVPGSLERGLEQAGLLAETAVKKRLVASIDLEPLAPSTIEGRRRRGIASEKPLIRTGQLLGSITHEVRDR